LIGTLVGVTKPVAGIGVHIGVGVFFGLFVWVGTGVGVSVGGGPGQIAKLISEKGKPKLCVLLLLPPPQLNKSAAERKHRTGARTKDRLSQIIES
jgi:hypothetical protein